ncbi:MAG: DUF4294 domain-containing protein [Bacteroidota bacterium]
MTKSIYIIRMISAMILLALFISVSTFSQNKKDKTPVANTKPIFKNKISFPFFHYNGETLPLITLSDFDAVTARAFKNEKEKQTYLKLMRDVRKVYPYAILASVKLREYDAILVNIPEKKRSSYLKKVEKELKMQFESDLKNLTINQGRILIRLINRETGMLTYKVIKDYRGSFSAILWQSFAFFFGNNLKTKYNPTSGEDKLIEEIIHQIEDEEV